MLAPRLSFALGTEADGLVQVYAFKADGRPARGLVVVLDGRPKTTDVLGAASFVAEAGVSKLRVQGTRAGLEVEVPVAKDVVTEVILRLSETGKASLVDMEAPGELVDKRGEDTIVKEQKTGVLEGHVLDEKRRPVSAAKVFVRGVSTTAQTDGQGRFTLRLPVGARTISVIHPDFATETRRGIIIKEAAPASVTLELTSAALMLDAVSISGYAIEGGLARLLEERQQDSQVSDVIGAEQISKSGDSNAASALRRVTGLSVVGGRYVYVRGMGERYSSTLLNNATLPSPEPQRRVVPLSLFPVDIIESVKVQKTYSADRPGEFGGGTVEVRTRAVPKQAFFKFGASIGANSETTHKRGLTYRGGRADALGIDDGTRELPLVVRGATAGRALMLRDILSNDGFTAQQLEFLGESVPNVWQAQPKTIPVDFGLKTSFGDRAEIGGAPVGALVAVNYSNSYRTVEKELRAFSIGGNNQLTPLVDYDSVTTTNTVNFGAILSAGVELGKDEQLRLTSLLVRTTRNRTQVYQGFLADDGSNIQVTSLDFVQEMLISNQLSGEHKLWGDIGFDWRYAYSAAFRDQPDFRRHRYDLDQARGLYLLSNRPEGNQRIYSELRDNNHDVGAQLTVPLEKVSVVRAVKVGGNYVYRDRESETRRFKFLNRGARSQDPDVLALPVEQVFAPENIGADGFSFEEITRATDSYEAEQTITAAFAVLDLDLTEALELSAGLRVERSKQQVTTFNLFDRGQSPIVADLDTLDTLPSINLTYRLDESMLIRAAYSQTVSRPDFRELSEAPFDLIIGTGVFIGNSRLDRALIQNYDLRWEWYFSAEESVSVGLFYKQLDDPIETVIRGGSNRTLSLENAPQGRNLGIELELRKQFGFLGAALGGSEDLANRFYFSGNFALIDSQVELANTGIQTEKKRPLQGQSEYVVNASLGYDDPEARLSFALLYNVAGERIAGIGALGLPDIIERPFHRLDLTASWGVYEYLTLSIKLQNLLDSRVVFEQDGQETESYRPGQSGSLGLTLSF